MLPRLARLRAAGSGAARPRRRGLTMASGLRAAGSRRRGLTLASGDDAAILSQMKEYAERDRTHVSMETLIKTGWGELLEESDSTRDMSQHELTMLQVGTFLRHELPIRFAHRARELDNMPDGLYAMPSIQKVKHWYCESFAQVMSHPETMRTSEEEESFRRSLDGVKDRHADTNIAIAQGLIEYRDTVLTNKTFMVDLAEIHSIHAALNRFFLARIGMRVIIGHYIALQETVGMPRDKVGLIDVNCVPRQVAAHAADDAMYMCERAFGFSPEVEFHGSNLEHSLPYVSSHLYYIMFELVKNSLRATVEFQMKNHGDAFDEDKLPPVSVIIADSEEMEDVVVKVSDQGGGIPRSHMPRILTYLFTTARSDLRLEDLDDLHDFGTANPLAGLGYGLPVAQTYIEYFGGRLTIMPVEGYGTDAFIYLPRIADIKEPLS